jgi:hypothetical protein
MKRFLLISAFFILYAFTLNGQEGVAFTSLPDNEPYFAEVPLAVDNRSEAEVTAEDRRAAALDKMGRPTSPMFFYSTEQIKIILWSNEEAQALIKIHTANGKLVKELHNDLMNRKENEILIPVSDLPTGAYWVSFFKDGNSLSSREYIKS